jgi:hypothetical protein
MAIYNLPTYTKPQNDISDWYIKTINECNSEILYALLEHNYFNPMAITIQNYLTDKQLDFLMSNTLSIFDKESATYIFIREIFKADEKNIPIDDSIFLCSIFELVNCYLYRFEVDKIIPTLNKTTNLKLVAIKNEIPNYEQDDRVGFTYKINPNKQTVRLEFNIYGLYCAYSRPYDKEATSLFNKIQYKVDNLNEFLFKVCTIYDEFIELMPQEELDLEGGLNGPN